MVNIDMKMVICKIPNEVYEGNKIIGEIQTNLLKKIMCVCHFSSDGNYPN